MIEIKRTEAVLPTAVASVRPQTTTPGASEKSLGRDAGPFDNVPPPAGLDHTAHASLFMATFARIVRTAVSEGRMPALIADAMDSRKIEASTQPLVEASVTGGRSRSDSCTSHPI